MGAIDGYLLIADISGYTEFLTSTELEHANPILRSLLEALVSQVGDPLHLWRMEGDAVLAYSRDGDFPTGHAFLTICENLYDAFVTRRTDIRANTTCPCRACANIETLDLKILAHFGSFEELQVGGMTDISGPAPILVHRMSKTDVRDKTGIQSYAMFSRAALDVMELEDVPMAEYRTPIEHFGELEARVYDLAAAWAAYRQSVPRAYIAEGEEVWTYRHRARGSARRFWEYLVDPALKTAWMGMRSVTPHPDGPRLGAGTRYHCVHDSMEFTYWITDWRPFDYFSTRFADPLHPGLEYPETYEFHELDGESELVYRLGQTVDAEGVRHEGAERATIEFLSGFWPMAFGAMDRMMAGEPPYDGQD